MNLLRGMMVLSTAYDSARQSDDWSELARVFVEDMPLITSLRALGGATYEGRSGALFYMWARHHLLRPHFVHSDITALTPVATSEDSLAFGDGYFTWRSAAGSELVFHFELRLTFDEDERCAEIEEIWDPETTAAGRAYIATQSPALQQAVNLLDLSPSEDLVLLNRGMELAERHVRSQNDLAHPHGPKDVSKPVWVECNSTWRAPDIPALSLSYGLTYQLEPSGTVRVEEHWDPAMKARLRAHLAAHGSALHKRAADRTA